MTIESPSSGAGITWRPLRPEHARRLHDLYAASEEMWRQPWRTLLEEIEHDMVSPRTDPGRNAMVAEDAVWKTDSVTFRDHWGSMPTTLEAWRHDCERPGYRRDLTVLAVDRRRGGRLHPQHRNE